jgi:hypothetical protein
MIYGLKVATHSFPIQKSFPLHLIDDSLQNRGGMQLFDTILKLAKF